MVERVCRALCGFHGNAADTRFEGKAMWESYVEKACQIINGAGIPAFLGVVRAAAGDPAMPENVRASLNGALDAFEGEAP
ncbi:hypothetical protein [Hyphomicrobium sp. DY-1]|uniref:hypothetical protein n=1 Tax=Hyphomicrobium sp. DY-1 TaxID=3075650 RepID=UPI0039C29699